MKYYFKECVENKGYRMEIYYRGKLVAWYPPGMPKKFLHSFYRNVFIAYPYIKIDYPKGVIGE
jgi:hypothetical protein